MLNARTPLELSNLYSAEDQKLMKIGTWDYKDPNLIVNKIKNVLETTNPRWLTDDEKEWRQEILWFWYHHAISCAIWRHKDKREAREYATKALEYQGESHPNKITRLLYLLVNDRVEEAKKWVGEIQEDPEKTTATDLLREYRETKFL